VYEVRITNRPPRIGVTGKLRFVDPHQNDRDVFARARFVRRGDEIWRRPRSRRPMSFRSVLASPVSATLSGPRLRRLP
jgi:hypothetical protein